MDDKLYKLKGYDGYLITKKGKIYSLKTKRFLKYDYSSEYPRVKLYNRVTDKIDTLLVHRLVAIQFIPNPRNLPYVNHKDSNKRNPSVYNLEWCTAQYNTQFAYLHGQMGKEEMNPNAKLTKIQVFDIYEAFESGKYSIKELAKIYNISFNCISDIVRGKRWTEAYKEYHNEDSPYKNIPKVIITDEEADFYIRQYWVYGKSTVELEGKFSQSTIERIVFGKRKKERFELFRKEIQKVLGNQQPNPSVLGEVQRL